MLLDKKMTWDGQGPVFLGKYDPAHGRPDMGYLTGIYQIGCGTSALTTTPSFETKTKKETCTGKRGTLSSSITARDLTVSFTAMQYDVRTLAVAFYGEAAAIVAGTVTDEPVAAGTVVGGYIFARFPNIKNVVLTDSADVPLVKDTHYVIEDAAMGRIRIIALPGAATVKALDYEYEPHAHIGIFSAGMVERGLIFCGINSAGQRGRLTIPKINFAMQGDYAWIGDEDANLQLQGPALYAPELQFDPQFKPGFGRIEFVDAP